MRRGSLASRPRRASGAPNAISRRPRFHAPRDREKRRPEPQLVVLLRRAGNIEAHAVLGGDEVNHAAARLLAVGFGDREDRFSTRPFEELDGPRGIDAAPDEQDLAPIASILGGTEA